MNRIQKTARNSAVSLLGQIITILLSFISRKVFLQYFGVALLGLNSTFASLLSTLSLAELGFQQVIVYHLYGVLATGNEEKINNLVNIYRLVYRWIGCFFIGAALCCTPFLQYILSDIEATDSVRLFFLIQALTGACTYFLAYKRNILYADQKSYISGLVDTVVNTSATIIGIFIAIYTQNYLLFLLINLAKTYLSNLIVHLSCTKHYPYLHRTKADWTLLRTIGRDLKNVVIERLASYIYSSTDNLLISIFISTVQVGFLNNYTMIFGHIKRLMQSLCAPIIPAIGNLVAVGEGQERQLHTFRALDQGYFWLSGLLLVPVYVLADSFIRMYLGAEFVLSHTILFLLCIDLYIHIKQDPCLCFMSANGMFQQRRNISILGGLVNIVVSALLIRPLGIAGILTGTAVSQAVYWAARSKVSLGGCLRLGRKGLLIYWLRQFVHLFVIVAAIAISRLLTQRIFLWNNILTLVLNGFVCELTFIGIMTLVCHPMEGQKVLSHAIDQNLLRHLKKHLKRH